MCLGLLKAEIIDLEGSEFALYGIANSANLSGTLCPQYVLALVDVSWNQNKQ